MVREDEENLINQIVRDLLIEWIIWACTRANARIIHKTIVIKEGGNDSCYECSDIWEVDDN